MDLVMVVLAPLILLLARPMMRSVPSLMWGADFYYLSCKGAPWDETLPVRSGAVFMPAREVETNLPDELPDPVKKPRQFMITQSDLQRFGYTTGCPGCISVATTGRWISRNVHNPECRRRISKLLIDAGDGDRAFQSAL